MGVIRFLLAAAVVLGHAPGWGRLSTRFIADGFLAPYYAVQAFFVISGFYMALIHGKYAGLRGIFYTNRYSRLAVSYWIMAATTLICALIYPDTPVPFVQKVREHALDAPRAALWFSNATMIGSDVVDFFKVSGEPTSHWTLIPQGWSLGAELWFYLLVPFLAPLRNRWIVLLTVLCAIVRAVIIAMHLPFSPWQQRFFPAELAFFLVGILCHRTYRWFEGRGLLTDLKGRIALGAGVLFVCRIGSVPWANVPVVWNSLALASVMFLLLPPIFHATRNSRIDRFIGEFSYPIYLWHIFIGNLIEPAQRLWGGFGLLLLLILFSLPLVLLVETRLEAWRGNRLRAARHALAG